MMTEILRILLLVGTLVTAVVIGLFSSVGEGWKTFFGMDQKSESPLKKLERDAKVYKQLSDIQKI